MTGIATINVEFFGMPRHKAGCAEASVRAENVAEVLAALEREFPGLQGLRRPDGGPAAQYLLSVDGAHFISDPRERLEPGCRLLLLSADVGG